MCICAVSTNCAQHLHVCTMSTDYTRVKGPMQPFLKGGALRPILHIVSSRLQHVHIHCTPPTHSVCRPHPGKRICAQCLQTVHSVYELCTVSTGMHSIYRLYLGKRICAECLQTGAQCLHVCMYTHIPRLPRDGVGIRLFVQKHTHLKPNHTQGVASAIFWGAWASVGEFFFPVCTADGH